MSDVVDVDCNSEAGDIYLSMMIMMMLFSPSSLFDPQREVMEWVEV